MISRPAPLSAVGLATVASLLALGCVSSKVRTDYDAEIDFSHYATYDWLEPPLRTKPATSPASEVFDPFVDNSLLDKRVRRAVDQQFAARGYRRVDVGVPDFRVQYHVIANEKTSHSGARTNDFGRRERYRAHRYQQGALFLDVIDAHTERIAWRGWTGDTNREGYFTEAQLTKSVQEVLAHFPPKGAKPPDEKAHLLRRVHALEEKLRQVEEQRKDPADTLQDPAW